MNIKKREFNDEEYYNDIMEVEKEFRLMASFLLISITILASLYYLWLPL